jgi:hypothetical protein
MLLRNAVEQLRPCVSSLKTSVNGKLTGDCRLYFVVLRGEENRVSAGNRGLQHDATTSRFTLRLHFSTRLPTNPDLMASLLYHWTWQSKCLWYKSCEIVLTSLFWLSRYSSSLWLSRYSSSLWFSRYSSSLHSRAVLDSISFTTTISQDVRRL